MPAAPRVPVDDAAATHGRRVRRNGDSGFSADTERAAGPGGAARGCPEAGCGNATGRRASRQPGPSRPMGRSQLQQPPHHHVPRVDRSTGSGRARGIGGLPACAPRREKHHGAGDLPHAARRLRRRGGGQGCLCHRAGRRRSGHR